MSKTRVTIGNVSGAIKVHYDGGVIFLDLVDAVELLAQLESALERASGIAAAESVKAKAKALRDVTSRDYSWALSQCKEMLP